MGDFMSFRGTFMRIDGEKNTQVIDRKIGHLELCLVNIIELTVLSSVGVAVIRCFNVTKSNKRYTMFFPRFDQQTNQPNMWGFHQQENGF